MGVFFRSPSIVGSERVITEAAASIQRGGNPDQELAKAAKQFQQISSGNEPRPIAFVTAFVLLAVMAGFALLAEAKSMTTATENLWIAFQTILGVIVGFLGGEATGVASKAKGANEG